MKIINTGKNITAILEDGTVLSKEDVSKEDIVNIFNNSDNENYVREILCPNYNKAVEERNSKSDLIDYVSNKSKILTIKGQSVYMTSVSELSIPEDLLNAIVQAEKDNNKELLETYRNFWTLVSLNPDSRARNNLFWFLNKYGMKISKSGLFVAYRRVEIKKEGKEIDNKLSTIITDKYFYVKHKLKKSPKNYYLGIDKNGDWKASNNKDNITNVQNGTLEELYNNLSSDTVDSTIYTDQRTRTFNIKLGVPVMMERSECDSDQEHTCSRGLHVASKQWLKTNNYFGAVQLMVLVNPADVVAVPPVDSYGKMRTCAYYPVKIVDLNDSNLDEVVEDGFEDDFINIITYNGTKSNIEENTYTINIPNIPELNNTLIMNRLDEMRNKINKLC